MVKPEMLQAWKEVKPQWFVMPEEDGTISVEQKRKPGLLKIEYQMDKGSAVLVCSKTYNLANYEEKGGDKMALKGVANDNVTLKHNDFLR